jgi:hypothetical protein
MANYSQGESNHLSKCTRFQEIIAKERPLLIVWRQSWLPSLFADAAISHRRPMVATRAAVRTTYKVEIEHEGKVHELKVPEGESILTVALESGVCTPMTC